MAELVRSNFQFNTFPVFLTTNELMALDQKVFWGKIHSFRMNSGKGENADLICDQIEFN